MIIIVKNRIIPRGKRIILESLHKKSYYAEEKERRNPELRDIELAEFSFDLFTSIRLPIEAYLPVERFMRKSAFYLTGNKKIYESSKKIAVPFFILYFFRAYMNNNS